ncbi:hypothetical protein B0I35DRAFT_403766 [Stachybotrys elegans]|uniref:Uncharacterized protein n=1 Tax=Stachybotrys elegans TaxID=80388 RepID=A0A8K0T6Q6_9HYPO|nr:hypothetical protein B0I35DRAFT_403766 [Stachybotrys elegans]
MIRSQWRSSATADLRLARLLSHSPSRCASQLPATKDWPSFQKLRPIPPKASPGAFPATATDDASVDRTEAALDDSLIAPEPYASPDASPDASPHALPVTAVQRAQRSPKDSSTVTLRIKGLSPNLNPSDFARLAPYNLSAWHQAIKRVQQQRHPTTFEPNGTYMITINTAEGAAAYRENLLRLHRLARLKSRSRDGLWKTSVPPHLRSPDQDPEVELQDFPLAPGTLTTIDITPTRAVKTQWTEWLARACRIQGQGFDLDAEPPLLLLHISPPLKRSDVKRIINFDGRQRTCDWNTSRPMYLNLDEAPEAQANQAQATQSSKRLLPLSERFALICHDDIEAERFHRHWNQRTVRYRGSHFVFRTSIVKW